MPVDWSCTHLAPLLVLSTLGLNKKRDQHPGESHRGASAWPFTKAFCSTSGWGPVRVHTFTASVIPATNTGYPVLKPWGLILSLTQRVPLGLAERTFWGSTTATEQAFSPCPCV